MIKILFTIIFFTYILNCNAQDESDVISYIGLNMGAAIPFGDFANNDINSSKAGFARTGLSINFAHFGMIFGEKLGFNIRWFGNANPMSNPYKEYTWGYGSFMFGVSYTFNLFQNMYLDLIPSVGMVSTQIYSRDVAIAKLKGLGLGMSIQYRYNFARKWAITTNLEYINSTQNGQNNTTAIGINQTINDINFNGGIIYYFKAPEYNRRSGGGF